MIEKIGSLFRHHIYVSNISKKNSTKKVKTVNVIAEQWIWNLLWLYSIRKNVINKNSEINNVISPICIPRRRPKESLYQEDQYESFISKDSVKDFTSLNASFPPVGILQVRKKQFVNTWSDRLYQNWLRFTCLTFFQRGVYLITPMVSPWKRFSFVSQKYVKKLSCLFTVT